jgi:hypothetical protein
MLTQLIVINSLSYKNIEYNDNSKITNMYNEFFTSFEPPNIYKKSECASFIFDRFKRIKSKHSKQLKDLNKLNFKQIISEYVEKLIS